MTEVQTSLQAAQQRLSQACLAQPMNPVGATISNFVSHALLSARVDALQELVLNPPNGTWTPQEALEAGIIRHLTAKAEALEAQARQIQIASAAPALIRPS